MTDRTPLKAIFNASKAVGMAEYASGDTVPVANGGTGATTASAARAGIGAQLEPGLIAYFGATAAPTGWLKCNGAAVSRTTYAALFTAIGSNFGSGDGSTTFNLPDLRGEFVRGWDDSRGVDSGRGFASSQDQDVMAHGHVLNRYPAAGNNQTPYYLAGSLSSNSTASSSDGVSVTSTLRGTGVTGVETRPRNIATLACIKY